MHRYVCTAFAVSLLTLTGCASLTPPTAQSLIKTPVVRFGEHAPENQPFVLWYPAGVDIPVQASVSGTLLETADAHTLNVRLKRDVYIYQQWVSFDGKSWEQSNHVVDGKLLFSLPGELDGISPGTLSTEFNLR